MLTPQALTILADNKNWHGWKLVSYSSDSGRLTSQWLPDFVNVYSASKGITDEKTKTKISHSMHDLIKNRYAFGSLTNQKGIGGAFLTDVAKDILKYIN
jgi:hypothetical protein